MINFKATILKLDKQGEKTGWSYINIPEVLALQLYPGNKKSFRVKGKLDDYAISMIALLPMGEGNFIMPVTTVMRNGLEKEKGAIINVFSEMDNTNYLLCEALLACLEDEPEALTYLKSLPISHQNYFSKWIEAAKTEMTNTKRISMVVNALINKWSFATMMHAAK